MPPGPAAKARVLRVPVRCGRIAVARGHGIPFLSAAMARPGWISEKLRYVATLKLSSTYGTSAAGTKSRNRDRTVGRWRWGKRQFISRMRSGSARRGRPPCRYTRQIGGQHTRRLKKNTCPLPLPALFARVRRILSGFTWGLAPVRNRQSVTVAGNAGLVKIAEIGRRLHGCQRKSRGSKTASGWDGALRIASRIMGRSSSTAISTCFRISSTFMPRRSASCISSGLSNRSMS